MDNEFVNLYIQRQAQMISELVSKNTMIETKYEILDKRFKELTDQHVALIATLEKARADAEQAASAETVKKESKRKQVPEQQIDTDTESQF